MNVDPPALFQLRGGVYTREGECDIDGVLYVEPPIRLGNDSRRVPPLQRSVGGECTGVAMSSPC